MLAVDDLDLSDIGQSLIDLGEQLQKIGAVTGKKESWDPRQELWESAQNEFEQLRIESQRRDEIHDAMTKTLAGLRMFRGNYDYWERVAAEYALTRLNFTQRRTATLLGVGLSTINRWAQHPVTTGGDEHDN